MNTTTAGGGGLLSRSPPEKSGEADEADIAQRLGIPPLFRLAAFEHFRPGDFRTGHRVLNPALRRRPRNVLIVGANGTGKSHLAAALAREWRARWVRVAELLARVRRTFKPHVEESEYSILEELGQIRALVLDDLTATSLREFGLACVVQLINRRIEEGLATIVTSHHKLNAIDALDSALASRLASFSRVELVGPDRRLRPSRPLGPGGRSAVPGGGHAAHGQALF